MPVGINICVVVLTQEEYMYSKEYPLMIDAVKALESDGHEIITMNKQQKGRKCPDIVSRHKGVINISETKFCLTLQELYSAIGQLIIYSLEYKSETVKLNIICPKDNSLSALRHIDRKQLIDKYNVYIWAI